MKGTFITTSFTETQKLGLDFASELQGGEVIFLYGDLGSGKTTFMQGLAKGLGITKNIISPTFIIMRTYKTNRSRLSRSEENKNRGLKQSPVLTPAKTLMLYHVDLYRISSQKDVEGLGLIELLHQPENVVAIEWPEKIEQMLPSKSINLHFSYLDDNKRQIQID